MAYETIEQLEADLDTNGNVMTITMRVLRDTFGKGRLGVHVRTAISNELRSHGIAHYPSPLSDSQFDSVRLYRLGTPIADLIDAVLNPSDGTDQTLREQRSDEVSQILDEVRQLVCQ